MFQKLFREQSEEEMALGHIMINTISFRLNRRTSFRCSLKTALAHFPGNALSGA